MKNFKFVERDEELNMINNYFFKERVLLLNSVDDSGLSHFLKKIWHDYCRKQKISFYINGEQESSLQEQIISQIVFSSQHKKIKRGLFSTKKKIVYGIVTSCVGTLDLIPAIPNIGTVINNLISGIKDTLDVDYAHIKDYKIEKGLIRMLASKYFSDKKLYIIIDNPDMLRSNSFDFLGQLIRNKNIHILLAFSNKNVLNKVEFLSKISSSNLLNPFEIDGVFQRPNDKLIEALFECYGKSFETNALMFFDENRRNIHVIMAYIHGFKGHGLALCKESMYILKILYILKHAIQPALIKKIFEKKNLLFSEVEYTHFIELCHELERASFLSVKGNRELGINKTLVNDYNLTILGAERQLIINDIIEVFIAHLDELENCHLKFAIKHLNKDYSRRKHLVMTLLQRERTQENVEVKYLDSIFSVDNENELLDICMMYYDLHIYDAPLRRMKENHVYKRSRSYKILHTIILERLHLGDYVDDLENLIRTSDNKDESCLLVAILFVAYLNSDEKDKYKEILYDVDSEFHHKKFRTSLNYVYLLRNIAYYLEDYRLSTKYYNQCLNTFKMKDPINYNRTISNYICFIMKSRTNNYVEDILAEKIVEIEHILEFNDPKYEYLSINYGIYLALYNNGDPTDYFNYISYDAGTTETPYIYAKINLAAYVAKTSPSQAIKIMDIIEPLVEKTDVPRTKQFYNINRCLIEYTNSTLEYNMIIKILDNPLRGDVKKAKILHDFYMSRLEKNIPYKQGDWIKLYLPGYIFYRYFKAEKLLSYSRKT